MGTRKKARRWKVHKALICRYSEYFEGACRHSSAGFHESVYGIFEFAQDSPIAFRLFIDWLYSNHKRDPHCTGTIYSDAWRFYAGEACILADKLIATDFAEFTLSRVIQYAHLLDVYDMEFIYENTRLNAPLRLFANQWVRWRCCLQPTLWESSRNGEFQRQRRRHEPNMDNTNTPDPRGFEIKHWYSECGRTGASCNHATVQTGTNPFTNVQTTPDLSRMWSKRERHDHFTQAKILLPAFCVAYSSVLVKLGVTVLMMGLLLMVILLSVHYCHCGHCHCSGCHGCRPCSCYPCHHWCTHHAFLLCCDCSTCQYCGGFPFCWCVMCCCRDGYDDQAYQLVL